MSDSRTEAGARSPEVDAYFPTARLVLYVVPIVPLLLFFPFRPLQWVSMLAVLFLLVAALLSGLSYRGVAARAVMPVTYSYPGDEVAMEFVITNHAPVPAVNLGITVFTPSEIPGQQKVQGLLSLAGRSDDRFAARIRMTRRGEYGLPLFMLEGSDPFSVFPWRISLRNACTLVVYPTIHHGVLVPKRGIPGGTIRVQDRIYEDVNRIGSIRDYIPGDDIRRIHWKASAKSGELRTSELIPALDAPSVVLLDMDAAAYPTRYRYARIERSVEVAASLVHALGESGQRVGLIANGLDGGRHPVIPPSGHHASAALALRVLARITADADTDDPISVFLGAGLSLQAGMRCYVVSPRHPDVLAPQLTHPTMVALKPAYCHLTSRRDSVSGGLPIDYYPLEESKELFDRAG